MLQEPFEVLGYYNNLIFFKLNRDVIMLPKRLPKEDMVLYLKVEPEDVKALRDEILVDASTKPLTYEQTKDFYREKTDGSDIF